MKFHDIQKIAKQLGVNTFGMNKVNLIRAIQRAEQNVECYATLRVGSCAEAGCLWRSDCASQKSPLEA